MRIAYFLTSLANAGPINVAQDLVRVMTAHGHKCHVYYFKEVKGTTFECPVTRLTLKSKVDFKNYDVVHAHGVIADLYLMLHLPLARKKRPRYFTTLHSFIFQDHAYAYGRFKSIFTTRLTLASTLRADKVITLGLEAMAHYKGHVPARKLTYAYNTRTINLSEHIDPDDIALVERLRKSNEFIVGAICSLTHRKGLEQLIKALSLLPKCGVLIVGSGYAMQELSDLAKQLQVSDRVVFVGQKHKGYRYLSVMDIFAIPSRSEGFPLALLEAACVGKPVVASRIPVFEELFTDSEIPKFSLDNERQLADIIQQVIHDKDTFAQRLHRKYCEAYSPEHFYKRHIKIYTDTIV